MIDVQNVFVWFLYIVEWCTKNNIIIAQCLRFNTQENINSNIILLGLRSILEEEKWDRKVCGVIMQFEKQVATFLWYNYLYILLQ